MKNLILKLIALLVGISIMLAFSVVGCGKAAESAEKETVPKVEEPTAEESTVGIEPPENEVTLDFWVQEWAGSKAWMDEWVSYFNEKYPTINVNIIYLPFEELNTKLFPSIAAGNEADIMWFYDDWLAGKDPAGLFAPITPKLYTAEQMKERVFSIVLDTVTGSDSEVYAAPMGTGSNAAGILYHKDILDEDGVDPLSMKTWDDVKEVTKKLTKYNDDGSIARSGILLSYTETANLFIDMIAAQGAQDKMFNSETGEWNFNIPEAKNALELLKYFVDEKIYNPTSGDPFTAFPNKLGAMLVIGPWAFGSWLDQYPDLQLGYVIMPKYPGTDKNVHNIEHWFNFGISKRLVNDEEKYNAALIYIKECIENPEFYNIPLNNVYWVGTPASKAYAEHLSDPANITSEATQVAYDLMTQFVPCIKPLNTNLTEAELIRSIIFPELQNVFLGQKTVEEVLDYLTTTLTTKEQESR